MTNAETKRKATYKWRRLHPEAFKASQARSHRKATYGITEIQFQTMLMIQCGKCANCGVVFTSETKSTSPAIDHNKKTGKVRGLLCESCNRGMGFFWDNQVLLSGAVDYLQETN